MKNCTPLWREAHFQVKMYKTYHARTTLEVGRWKNSTLVWREADVQFKMYKTNEHPTTFGTWDMKQLHVAVAQSTLASQNVQKTASLKPFLELRMSKNCKPLWPEAHWQVKMLKISGVWATFGSADVQKLNALVARSTCRSDNAQNTSVSEHFLDVRMSKSVRRMR